MSLLPKAIGAFRSVAHLFGYSVVASSGTSQAQSLNLTKSPAQSLDVAGSGFPAQRIVQRNCLFMTSVAFFEFQIYTANQQEGASLPLARS